MTQYKIVFNGELMPDASLDSVKTNLARLFKSDLARIDSLFNSTPLAIKRGLAAHEAEQYMNALQKAGAKVYREEEPAKPILALVPTEEHNQAQPSVAHAAASTSMQCPKCGHEQEKSASCSACGIIIEKYQARQAQLAVAPATPATTSPYQPPQADVSENLPEFGELKPLSVSGRIGRVRYLGWSMAMLLCALPVALLTFGVSTFSTVLGTLLIAVLGLAMVVISVCLGVQRLHDIGWSGWLWLINFVPFVGGLFSLLLLVVPGSQSTNRYGPPPPPNSTGVTVLAWLCLLVPLVGIAAAIAIPAYQSYLLRAAS